MDELLNESEVDELMRAAVNRPPKYIYCPTCGGAKVVSRTPFWATVMPEKTKQVCPNCQGEGRLLVVGDADIIIREGVAKKRGLI